MIINVPDYPDPVSAASVMKDGDTLYFPADHGPYIVPAGVTLDLSRLTRFTLKGDGFVPGHPTGSYVVGATDGDLVRYVPSGDGNGFDVEGLNLRNTSRLPASAVLHVENVNCSRVSRCQFIGSGIGLNAPAQCFGLTVECSKFNGLGAAVFPGSIGLVAFSHTYLRDLDVTGWGEGLRMAGTGVNLTQARIETCGTGLRLGINPSGVNWSLSRAVIQGVSMEACDTAVYIGPLQSSVFGAFGISGSVNAPSGQSIYGIYDAGQSQFCLFGGVVSNGWFSRAAIRVADAARQTAWVNTLAQNLYVGGLTWQYGG